MIDMRQKKPSGRMHISELWNRDLFTMIRKSTKLREIRNFKLFTKIYKKEIGKMLEKVKEDKGQNPNDLTNILEEINEEEHLDGEVLT